MKYTIVLTALSFVLSLTHFACGESRESPPVDNVTVVKDEISEFEAITISVNESNVNTLMILLASDGTINRKGTIADTSDNNFLMGVTDQHFLDSVNAGIGWDLLNHCDVMNLLPECDTMVANTKVELTFASRKGQKSINWCVEGNFDQLPAPIRNYILNAQRITAVWHAEQMKTISK